MDSHAPAPTSKKIMPHLLAVASPTAELSQFAREALWMANERDLDLVLAVREVPRLHAKLAGVETTEDIAEFAKRWNITLVPWRSSADLEAIINSWTVRRPARVLLGPHGVRLFKPGIAPSLHRKLLNAAHAQGIDISVDTSSAQTRISAFGFTWRTDKAGPWYHAYILSALAVSLAAVLVNWLDGILSAESLGMTFLTAVVYSAATYGMAPAIFTVALSVATYNYFFIEPKFALDVSSPEDVLTIIVCPSSYKLEQSPA